MKPEWFLSLHCQPMRLPLSRPRKVKNITEVVQMTPGPNLIFVRQQIILVKCFSIQWKSTFTKSVVLPTFLKIFSFMFQKDKNKVIQVRNDIKVNNDYFHFWMTNLWSYITKLHKQEYWCTSNILERQHRVNNFTLQLEWTEGTVRVCQINNGFDPKQWPDRRIQAFYSVTFYFMNHLSQSLSVGVWRGVKWPYH